MCHLRRVFYECLHEDHDVTPPRQIIYCSKAEQQDDGTVKPCAAADTLPLTAKHDFFSAVMRTERCEDCAAGTSLFADQVSARNTDASAAASSSETPVISRPGDSEQKTKDAFKFDWGMDKYLPEASSSGQASDSASASSASIFAFGTPGLLLPEQSSIVTSDFQLFGDENDQNQGTDEFLEDMQDIGKKSR